MKWYCTVCGYVYEGPTAPEFCPQCKAPASKFKEVVEGASFATVHEVGVAQGVSEDILKDLRANFEGECSEVGMYLAMARVADREGYPEISAAFTKYAFEEAEHAAKFAELLGEVITDSTKKNLQMLSLIHISEPTRLGMISYAVFCLKKKKIPICCYLSLLPLSQPPRQGLISYSVLVFKYT